jgi:branched-chain amino acid aminotransferase
MSTLLSPLPSSSPSMADRDGFIWLDGALVPWRDATTHVLTHSLHYAVSVFEGVRAYTIHQDAKPIAAIFRLQEHTERLMQSAHIMQMEIPFSEAELNRAQTEVVRANQFSACYIRPLVFLGSEKMGLAADGVGVHVAIAAWPWQNFLGEHALAHGIRVKTSSYQRHHVNVQLCRAKSSSNYANAILANREARADGYDEALLLDTQGFVAEGPGENLFIVKNGVLIEPELASGLDGITRRTILELAHEMGVSTVSRRLTRDDVYLADEAFFTGTAAEVTPIVELDRRKIGKHEGRYEGKGKPGAITQQLQKRYFDCVHGRDAAHKNWLTPV